MRQPTGEAIASAPIAQVDLGATERRKPGRRRWRVYAAACLGVVTFSGSTFLAWGIADPEGPLGEISPLAWVHDQRADDLLEKPHPTPDDLRRAEMESWTALDQAPVDDRAWLGLAYADYLKNGARLSSKGLLWLQRSYDVAPFGPDSSLWRLKFCLENWSALTPELRGEAMDEFRMTASVKAPQLKEMARQMPTAESRIAALLMLDQAQRLAPANRKR